jgi:biopolymer transport protein ExbD
MRIGSPWPEKKARIEIIPLIDIMFFLLASFMLASLSMMRLQTLKMNLPTATVAQPGAKPDIINIAVDQLGNLSIDKQAYNDVEMAQYLSNRYHLNTNVPVYITGDDQATHGRIVSVLDLVRSVGIQNASFAISSAEGATK